MSRSRKTSVLALALAAALLAVCAGPAAAATIDVPISFKVHNTNTSKIPCAVDNGTYTIKGHLVGPSAKILGAGPRAATLYVHGLGYGEFFWHDTSLPDYDYATRQANENGLVSVTIDRLGYGASSRPDGSKICIGGDADYVHQIIGQLRAGSYSAAGNPGGPAFARIGLAGHSLGGFIVEAENESYHDVDALVVNNFGNTGASLLAYATFGTTTLDCTLQLFGPHYAPFGQTAGDFAAAHFYNADPAVEASVVARRSLDPCGDTGSALQSIAINALNVNTIKNPVLIVEGGNDALFPPPAGPVEKLLFLRSDDVSQVTIPATGHAITFGRTAPQYRATVAAWLKAHGF